MAIDSSAERGQNDSLIGSRIDDFCLERGWDRCELAKRAKVSRTTLFQIGRGAVSRPRASTLKRIADALGVNVEQLTSSQSSFVHAEENSTNRQKAMAFDRDTNPAVIEVSNQEPLLFTGWLESDWQELYSAFGTGGQLTSDGVREAAAHINRKRETIRRLNIVLETHLHDVAVNFVDSLFKAVQPNRVSSVAVNVAPPQRGEKTTDGTPL